jgi:1-acyl-sn-glycerol-3-phosphate acyltransferase
MYTLMRATVRLLARTILAGLLRVEGRAGVPRRGGLLVCSNHLSAIDPALVPGFLPRRDSWSMAKSEWFERPGFTSWLLRTYHAFGVVRHTPDRRALRQAREILDRGGVLVLYPEGHRSETGQLLRAEPGAGFLARASGVEVVPVGLVGTGECVPLGSSLPRRVPVEIRFGPRLRIPERTADGRRVDNQDASDAIMLAIAELLPPELRGEYADLDALRARLHGVFEPAPATGTESGG